jgi:hypothetical protein
MARKSTARKTTKKPAAKGKFLLQKSGRRTNTQKGNARKGKSFVTTASKKKGVVQHVYNINGKRVVVDVKKKGAKASPSPSKGGRTYKRAPKGSSAGGQFSK